MDLGDAVGWFGGVLQVTPTFQNSRIATFVFGEFTVILDACEENSRAVLGFDSQDCDTDYRALCSRGAIAVAEPKDQPWGARAAYIKGPAALTIEFEQMLPEE